MPELPEVQTVVTMLQPLVGRRFGAARVLRRDVIHGERVGLDKFARGREIRAIRRQAKRIIIDIGADRQIVVHLGMTGRLTVCKRSQQLPPHTHLRIGIAGTKDELRFRDVRRFGGVWLLRGDENSQPRAAGFSPRGSSCGEKFSPGEGPRGLKPTARGKSPRRNQHQERTQTSRSLGPLGPDALEITLRDFRGLLRRNRQIKALLLDQTAIGGLGNIYVDESLHRAGIHPVTIAGDLADENVKRLHQVMRRTLQAAIKCGGSTISDYRTPSGERGWFQLRHQVYGREGEPCRRCRTPIERIQAAGRSSHICPQCQRSE